MPRPDEPGAGFFVVVRGDLNPRYRRERPVTLGLCRTATLPLKGVTKKRQNFDPPSFGPFRAEGYFGVASINRHGFLRGGFFYEG